MKILQISGYDLLGAQANGYLLHKYYLEKGMDSSMIVFQKTSTDDRVYPLNSRFFNRLNTLMVHLQRLLSVHCLLTPLAAQMFFMRVFWKANIINIQLLHNAQFFSLLMLPILTRFKKRVIITVHDMFLMTGNCVHPVTCERWKTGCGSCPDLTLPFAIKRDTTAFIWNVKKWIFKHSKIDLIVGSQWQYDRVKSSPLLSHLPVHHIHYGIDRNYYLRDKKACRALLDIPGDVDVIAFRSVPYSRNFKGTEYILKALENYIPKRETYLLTFEGKDGLSSLREKYKFVELGWLSDTNKMAIALNAADIFLMPSIAESFGLMAVEAMACGTPSIVFEGTALPKTVNAPYCGIAVPYKDTDALTAAIKLLLYDVAYRMRLKANGLAYVQANHTFEAYGDNYLALYQKLYNEILPKKFVQIIGSNSE
jgi:glycosyltransferase involved in cell wall biosynthesis